MWFVRGVGSVVRMGGEGRVREIGDVSDKG